MSDLGARVCRSGAGQHVFTAADPPALCLRLLLQPAAARAFPHRLPHGAGQEPDGGPGELALTATRDMRHQTCIIIFYFLLCPGVAYLRELFKSRGTRCLFVFVYGHIDNDASINWKRACITVPDR